MDGWLNGRWRKDVSVSRYGMSSRNLFYGGARRSRDQVLSGRYQGHIIVISGIVWSFFLPSPPFPFFEALVVFLVVGIGNGLPATTSDLEPGCSSAEGVMGCLD